MQSETIKVAQTTTSNERWFKQRDSEVDFEASDKKKGRFKLSSRVMSKASSERFVRFKEPVEPKPGSV